MSDILKNSVYLEGWFCTELPKGVHIGKKVSSTTKSLWEMRRIITKSLRNSVYNALVNSHLSYAISVWGSGANESKLKPLFTIQKRCLRNLFKIRKVSEFIKGHTKSTFNNHKILSVYNLYFYFTVSCIARLRQLRSPEYLYSLLNIDIMISIELSFPYLKRNIINKTFCIRDQNYGIKFYHTSKTGTLTYLLQCLYSNLELKTFYLNYNHMVMRITGPQLIVALTLI